MEVVEFFNVENGEGGLFETGDFAKPTRESVNERCRLMQRVSLDCGPYVGVQLFPS
jgi:hypothetical protein